MVDAPLTRLEGDKPPKVYHDFEKKPFLIILDEDLRLAAHMVTDKDVKAYVRNCFNLMLRTYLKLAGVPMRQNVYEQIMSKQPSVVTNVFPGLDERFIPKKPPMTKATELKFTKMCANHFDFVADFCEALLDEHVERFGKAHRNEPVLSWIREIPPVLPRAPEGYKTVYPIRTIPFRYREGADYVASARRFYRHLHPDPLKDWKRCSPPWWMQDVCDASQLD